MGVMKLRTKTSMILGIVIMLSVALNYGVLRSLVFPSFIDLEQSEAKRDMGRVREAFESDLAHLAGTNSDWGQWDDTHQYAVDRNQNYEEENLYPVTFDGLGIDVVYIYNENGEIVTSRIYDHEIAEEISVDRFVLDDLSPSNPLLQHAPLKEIHRGIMRTAKGPMLLTSAAILNNNGEEPKHGTLIFGRFLAEDVAEALREQTRVNFQFWAIGQDELAGADQEALVQVTMGDQLLVLREAGDDTLSAYSVFRDFENNPVLLIRTDTPKNISAIGMNTVQAALLGLVVAGLIAMLVIAILLGRLIINPLLALKEHILSVGKSGDLSKRIGLNRGDEIGILATQFDHMVTNLAEARDRLQQQSFQAGIAEMAAGVLHNVRNQLNPLVLRLGRLQQLQTAPDGSKFAQVLAELSAEHTELERRNKLIEYLRLAEQKSVDNQQKLRDEIDLVVRQVALVEEVLAEQDRFSRTTRTIEPTSLAEGLAQAQRMMPDNLGKAYAITVDPAIEELPPVLAEKFVLAHIINNLLVNAAEAIDASATEDGQIEVSVKIGAAADGSPLADLQVRDNGCGIAPDQFEMIFERGFTTKTDGKGGSGLHWCANSIANLNGRIYAESAGPSHGTTLHVLVPIAALATQAAA